jgi:hypothetical protein
MRRFVEGIDREQATLFPECLEDWIDQDNPVRAIDAFVDNLDLPRVGFEPSSENATHHRRRARGACEPAARPDDGLCVPAVLRQVLVVVASQKCRCIRAFGAKRTSAEPRLQKADLLGRVLINAQIAISRSLWRRLIRCSQGSDGCLCVPIDVPLVGINRTHGDVSRMSAYDPGCVKTHVVM